jgi:hypothetical protein
MMTQLTLRAAYLGIALSLMLAPAVSGAQQVDLKAAVAAKAAAGQEARAHTTPDAANSVGTFISFDVPGAGTGFTQGTYPFSINPAGTISGVFIDANFLYHGFLRASNGTITKFDVAGAVGGLSAPWVINPAGTITGGYIDANVGVHGFVRASNGTITTFDAPGAGTFFQGTQPFAINPAGTITGSFVDANSVSHGFVRDPNGLITTFDAPGACTTTCPPPNAFLGTGTEAAAIGPDGTIVGVYTDVNNNNHGFLRATDGTFSTFDPPGFMDVVRFPFFFSGQFLTTAADLYINPGGVITGTYFQSISGNPFGGDFRVFMREPDGTFTTFDGATYPPCCIFSFPLGINPAGVITGGFNDGFNINRGFVRATDGTVTIIDAPGAGTGNFQGTVPLGITPAGVITGFYTNNNGNHGFVLLPSATLSASSQ